MKKKVVYNYKLSLTANGEPENSQCECPSGRGPHSTCKHISSVLLMLEEFVREGNIQIKKTCTESLQKFHKPKYSYEGKPKPVEELSTKRKFSSDLLEDPRPTKYRHIPGYTDYVRNCAINFCYNTSMDLGIRYIIPAANIQMTEESRKQIELRTKMQDKCKEWYAERRWRLTASRFGDIVRMTSRRNIRKLCEGLFSNSTLFSAPILHGKKYEKDALSKFENVMSIATFPSGFFICIEYPYLGATPDAIIDEQTIIEIKCPYKGRNKMVSPGSDFPYLTKKNGKTVLNQNTKYYDQIQGQLFISKRKYCYFVVYTFCDIFIQNISINDDYCRCSLIPKLELFYTKHYRPFIASKL